MKRTYLMIGSLLLAIGILAFGISQWNTKLATTTEKAKKELTVAAKEKEALRLNDDSAANVEGSTNGSNSSSGNSGSGAGTGSTSTSGQSAASSGSTTSEATKEQSGSSPSENSASNNTSKEGTSSKTAGNTKNSGTSTPSSSQSVAEIKAAYQTVFNDFEVQETSKIDQLMVQAKADYVSNKLSKADIAVKYQAAAATLESNADKTFNAIYGQLQNDLEKNGHNANGAAEFRSNYQTEKQQRLSRVMNQVQNL